MQKWLFIGFIFVGVISCTPKKSGSVFIDPSISVADTIVYEALIHNTDVSETWKSDWLKGLDKEKLVNQLFESIYNKKVKVVDYDTKVPMTTEQVQEWESNNPRSAIGKLQFTETWGWDVHEGRFLKRVIAILPAYEAFNEDGSLRGYKAGIQVLTNN